jgi:dipeptidyl aminopeptidase/acylaminoacyl peptidase
MASAVREAPFGAWASPVTADLIAGATIRLGQVALLGDDIFWSEGRPQEQGRNVVVRRTPDGTLADVNPAPFNVRTRAHEYGGGAFVPLAGDAGPGLVFSHYDDQQLYRIDRGGAPRVLTHDAQQRYADAIVDAPRRRLVAVREDHRGGDIDAVASLVAVDLRDGNVQVLLQGPDFLASPRLSPDGRRLAWLSWDHPNMPWDGSTLWLADLADDGSLGKANAVAGGASESIFQPEWSPRGELHFASDRSGWWNLYRLRGDAIEALHPMDAEFGEPQWAFAMATYGFDGRGQIVCTFLRDGVSRLATLDSDTGRFTEIATPFCAIEELHVGRDFAVFVAGSPTLPSAIVRLDLRTHAHEVLRQTSSATLAPAFVALARPITFPTEGGLQAHAFFYPPTNGDFVGPAGARPPLIVINHGGPTGSTDAAFTWSVQNWTSRGFAIVDVNYGGSHGYGRAYRQRLNGQWGVVDVDDAINAARTLIERGEVDPDRVVIRGASAGGYTTLAALTFRRFFKAGASHYGIGDLEALAADTHKFESRYLDTLIGPYPAARALYRERSPVHHTDALASPMILFQGAEDKAVPPAQAQTMYDAVRAKGLPVAYLVFEGEQHGFRRAATIRRTLEAELYFYGQVFGFAPADAIEAVPIANLAQRSAS